MASESQLNIHRKQRVSKLISAQFDLEADPYVFKNHLGNLECRLCLTSHLSSESYVTHTQGKRHQLNLSRRATLDAKGNRSFQQGAALGSVPKKTYVKIGKPGYKIVKIRDVDEMELGFLITVKYPELKQGEEPLYRFMSAFEQQLDTDTEGWQYLVVHGEPYENVAFKVPSKEITKDWAYWDEDLKEYYIQFLYKGVQQ